MASRLLIAMLALALSACEMRFKTAKTPAPPQPTVAKTSPPATPPSDEPLSIPQTQVQLPRPQPIDPEALAMPPIILPEPPAQRPRRAGNKPLTPSPLPPKPEEPVEAPTVVAEAPRPKVEPVLPADERRQLVEEIAGRLKLVEQMLGRIDSRQLSQAEKRSVASIRSFLALSHQALEKGETQQAQGLADRAFLLAQELLRER